MPPAVELVVINGFRAVRGDLHDLVSRRYPAQTVPIEQAAALKNGHRQGLVIDVDLGSRQRAEDARARLKSVTDDAAFRVCIVDDATHTTLRMRAQSLGADEIIGRPIEAEAFYQTVDGLMSRATRRMWEERYGPQAPALIAGTDALAAMFALARNGQPITEAAVEEKSGTIVDALLSTGLGGWIEAVRTHHGQTFHHCLLVTGIAVAFGESLGCRRADLNRLATAGLLHDIGKSSIPVEILEKPGPLTETETQVMRTHADLGAKILAEAGTFTTEMLDVVAHHHEYLDGSGYPHGLRGDEINDLVRVITISDIFGALIEARAYKPPMPSARAYSILREMGPKLDQPLVKAFERIAAQIAPLV